jgi:hypothetical protein
MLPSIPYNKKQIEWHTKLNNFNKICATIWHVEFLNLAMCKQSCGSWRQHFATVGAGIILAAPALISCTGRDNLRLNLKITISYLYSKWYRTVTGYRYLLAKTGFLMIIYAKVAQHSTGGGSKTLFVR